MGANHSHVTIYMVQSMAPKAPFSTLCVHSGILIHVVRPQWHPCPRCAPTMASLSTLCAHNGCPRCAPTIDGILVHARCAPTMASLSTLCVHNGTLLHVLCPQWHPCPRCASTMAPFSMFCAHNGILVHVALCCGWSLSVLWDLFKSVSYRAYVWSLQYMVESLGPDVYTCMVPWSQCYP